MILFSFWRECDIFNEEVAMVNKNKCPNCGANLIDNPDYKFCPYCAVEIPKVEEKQPLNIFQTNQNITTIYNNPKRSIVDKFLDHRQGMRTIRAEEKLSRVENERRTEEARIEAEYTKIRAEREKQETERAKRESAIAAQIAANAEAAREAEKRKKVWGCAIIAMAPILLPIIGNFLLEIIRNLQ